MTDLELLEKMAIAQESIREKYEKEKKEAKPGRIYKSGNNKCVITYNDGDDICMVYNDGFAEDECLEDFNLGELVAEYSTWQEAVNSKEFKND